MKTCTKCGIEKNKIEFTKVTKSKDGLNCHCKECVKKYRKINRSSYEGLIVNRWNSLNQRCVNGLYANSSSVKASPQFQSYHKKGITINISKDEFVAWMYLMKPVHESIVAKGEKSSIDRIDENKGYTIDNIRLISLHENIENRYGRKCNIQTTEQKVKNQSQNRRNYQKAKNGTDN